MTEKAKELGELYLKHYGVKGMKWGVRRYQPYQPGDGQKGKGKFKGGRKRPSDHKVKGIKGRVARSKNRKIDKSFKKWEEEDLKKKTAIEKGKKYNKAKMESLRDPKNKDAKKEARALKKEYKKSTRKTTTHRKGQVKGEVKSDMSRKYLSEAKKVEKELEKSPSDKSLQKKHDTLMTEYNIARADARKAPEVAKRRSQKIAGVKRARTMAIKGVATATATTAGIKAVDLYLEANGNPPVGDAIVKNAVKYGAQLYEISKYI